MSERRYRQINLTDEVSPDILLKVENLINRSLGYGDHGMKIVRDDSGKLIALVPYFDERVDEREQKIAEQYINELPDVKEIAAASVHIQEDFEGAAPGDRPLGWHEWQVISEVSADQASSGSHSMKLNVPANDEPHYAAITIFSDAAQGAPVRPLMEYGGHELEEFSLSLKVYLPSDLTNNTGGANPESVMFAIFPGSFPPPESPKGFTPFVWMSDPASPGGPYGTELHFNAFGPWDPQIDPALALPLDDAWHSIKIEKRGASTIIVSTDGVSSELEALDSDMRLTVPPAIYIGVGRGPGNAARTLYIDDVEIAYTLK